MPERIVEIFEGGGIDSRANPLHSPPNRTLRSINWVRTPGGWWKLRHGFTKPTMTGGGSGAIHSAFFMDRFDGSRFIIYGEGTALKVMEIGSSGTVSQVDTLSNSNKWDAVFANNLVHLANGTDHKFGDGNGTWRDSGLRAPTAAEYSSFAAAEDTTSTGSWSITQFGGYDLYAVVYNPTTGHMGNRIKVTASRLEITLTDPEVVLTGLPDLSGEDTEFVKLVGRTSDGSDVPYAFIDSNGDFIVVGNAATSATITNQTVDFESELPTRNGVPPSTSIMAWVGGRMLAVDAAIPNIIAYTEREDDAVEGRFMGRPEQAWPANNRKKFSNSEQVLGIHSVDNEAWCWSRNVLAILSEFGGFSQDGRPALYWRGVWHGGIANQRAFALTNYGPFWVSFEKQLMTRTPQGPAPVSEEYEAALLNKIATSQIPNIELIYYRDPSKGIDKLYILGNDGTNPLLIVHDFKRRSGQSPIGEGSEYQYTGLTLNTFVHSHQQVISMRDENGQWQLWAGDTGGTFNRLENGNSDNGAEYTADMVQIINLGPRRPMLNKIAWQGDGGVKMQVSTNLRLTSTQLDSLNFMATKQEDDESLRYKVQIEEYMQYAFFRMNLPSHFADGSLDDSSPTPHLPVETYGRVYALRPGLGKFQAEGGPRK